MKFHPGKIITILKPGDKDIISATASTEALIEMWDENILTFTVDAKIAGKVKKNDIVLVDYNPISEKLQMPRTIITKILRGKTGDETWKKYKEYEKRRKAEVHVKKMGMATQEGAQVPKSVYR